MYDKSMIYLDLLPSNMNHMHKNVIFKPPPDSNEQMNFLVLLLIQKEFSLEVDMYWITTTIDTTISSFHITP
jgi:hypothetical protein